MNVTNIFSFSPVALPDEVNRKRCINNYKLWPILPISILAKVSIVFYRLNDSVPLMCCWRESKAHSNHLYSKTHSLPFYNDYVSSAPITHQAPASPSFHTLPRWAASLLMKYFYQYKGMGKLKSRLVNNRSGPNSGHQAVISGLGLYGSYKTLMDGPQGVYTSYTSLPL